MSLSVKEFSKAAWVEIYNRIIGAVVFLDDPSAECLHWDGGLFNLLSGGAVAVKSLSPFEYCKSEHKKALFITQATATQLSTIKEIIQNSDFTHCLLASTVSLDVVYLELNKDKDVSDIISAGKAPMECAKMLESMLLQWINKVQSAVEVIHVPISTISLTSNVFVMPPYSPVYPLYEGKLIPTTPSVDLYTLSESERSQVRRLVSSLNSMLEGMNLKEEVYYMGTHSSILAGVLENSPVCLARRKLCSSPASLLLIDRTLDLCGCASPAPECLLDKVLGVLPRLPGHSTDVTVDMTPLCEASVTSVTDDLQLSPGCLYHANDKYCVQTFEQMINKTQKEVMFDLYNKLSKIDVQRSPGPKTLLKVTPQSMEKIINATKGNYDIIEQHLGLLQQALAVAGTLRAPQHAQLELAASLQRQVTQNIAASREATSVGRQLSLLIKSRKERGLPLERLLALLVSVYSLAGDEVPFPKQHEEALVETLSVAIFEDHKSVLSSAEGRVVSPEQCAAVAADVLSKLKDIAKMRRILNRYNTVLKPTETGAGHEYRGVLQQLVDDLVDSARPELVDLRHRNHGVKDLLRSGLNILTSKKSRKHPMDAPTVILFIIGGVSLDECRRLHRAVITSGVDANVIIGSTKIVTSVDAMRDVLRL
ncbi:sec1 family domain-containing protein 2 isoform X2 [Plutella xylostella]|uniref:sec1 family domain-containing protein 2 isoform X2 n=1 Tax=Plutella xylostella TaxID=51655 RepID=UPI00203300C3|nr:sec1 family domain-containing protein 2 isoform X2 [Plutella xylostella]